MQPEQLHDPRVAMAAERTLLAWVRTSLAMMGFGFIVAKFGLFLREMAAVNGVSLKSGAGLSLWIGGAVRGRYVTTLNVKLSCSRGCMEECIGKLSIVFN